jgi:hypothetical protein
MTEHSKTYETAIEMNRTENFAFILSNPELFPDVQETEIAEFETLAARGDILLVLQKKTTFSANAQNEYADMLSALAHETAAGVKKSGTSGQYRVAVPTTCGKLTVVLDPNE